jgi:hemoglobin
MTSSATMLATLDAEARETCASSPFVAIGGASAVAAVVDEFYSRLLADPVTAGYFTPFLQHDGLAKLKRHQVLLLAKVLGGPDRYDGRDLGAAHKSMPINDDVYQRVSLYLLTVLHDFRVPMDILQAASDTLSAVRPAIVNQHGGAHA